MIVNDDEIKEINKTHRSKDITTDVLSFPFNGDFEQFPLGSIIISVDTAKKQSNEAGHSLETELKILFLHGMLHILGFDHVTDSGEMANEEERLRKKFNLPVGLIKRNS
jgi:probable rRNA maturation factor